LRVPVRGFFSLAAAGPPAAGFGALGGSGRRLVAASEEAAAGEASGAGMNTFRSSRRGVPDPSLMSRAGYLGPCNDLVTATAVGPILLSVTLSEALDRARRERLGEDLAAWRATDADEAAAPTVNCEKCNCIGFPELVDLVLGTVEMVCPACHHVWIADRSAIPTA
jgi:hypothetical protein